MELIRTLFLAGNVWPLIFKNCAILAGYAVLLLGLARFVTRKKLDWKPVMLDFFRRIVSLCRKELLAILKDPANRVILVVPSLVESFLFGYAATYDLTNVPYALLDQSRGAPPTELVARLDGTGVFHRVATLQTQADIARVIDSGKALMVIHFGPRFRGRN